MTAIKVLHLLSISALAILACILSATPSTALATGNHHLARHVPPGHNAIAKKKKRSGTKRKRCKPAASTPPTLAHDTTTSKPTPTPTHSTTTAKSAPTTTSSSGSSGGKSGGNSGGKSGGQSGSSSLAAPSGNGKVGLAWPNGNTDNLQSFITDKVVFVYTWSPEIVGQSSSVHACPMLWGSNQIDQFSQLVKPGYAECVMGMNEPNEPGQSNMTPQQGVDMWLQYIEPLKDHGYTLISPATSSNPNGKVWMQNFLNICGGKCTWDAVAVHWYDVSADNFKAYLQDFHDTFNLPIFVTEFACQNFNNGPQCTADQTQEFYQTVIPWMNQQSWVTAYFVFGAMEDMQGVNPDNQIMNSAGQPNDFGYQYINDRW